MPTAMHPWMDPNDVELWPHGTRVIYDTFDRIFSCKGHGWANLQSLQINLPFAGDEEFARLHAAIRFLLPILPGLAASSPIIDGERNGVLDNRLVVYRGNCARIPSDHGRRRAGAGGLDRRVPASGARADLSRSRAARSRRRPAQRMGQRARRDRALRPQAIEIRVLDIQETPVMDVAYAELIVEVLKLFCAEQWLDRARHGSLAHRRARQAVDARGAARRGRRHRRQQYLAAFGLRSSGTELKGLWEHLIETVFGARLPRRRRRACLLEHYLRHGTLATRIGKAVGLMPTRAKLMRVYEELCEALADSRPFAPPPPPAR